MTRLLGFMAIGAAVVASSVAVQAADLNGGYSGRGSIKDHGYSAPAPSGCPSWYARVDGGYSTFDRPSIIQINVDDWTGAKIDSTWSVGGGIGTYLSCSARFDVTIDRRFDTDVKGANANPFSPAYSTAGHKLGLDSTLLLANAYYDFNARGHFNPYVGIGLGAVRHNVSGGSSVGLTGIPLTIEDGSNWHVAGALMTGFTVALRDRMTLDAGYRFLYLGQAKSGNFYETGNPINAAGPVNIDEIHAHEFRVGLRYDIR